MVMHARDTFTGAVVDAKEATEVDHEAKVMPRKPSRLTMKPFV